MSGAASGAAAGTAILPGWGTAIGAVVGGVGGLLSGEGAASAQSAANRAQAQAAAQQSAQAFSNYLSSRGINLQQLVQNDSRGPDFWTQQYANAQAQGDRRDFQSWLVAAIQAAPTDPIWNAIANPAAAGGAQNTSLPAWAVDANGQPLQPSLLQAAVEAYNKQQGTTPIGQIATLQNVTALLAAHPEIAAELTAAGVDNDPRGQAQWLVDHITQTEAQAGGGRFTDALKSFVANPPAGSGVTAPPATPGSGGTVTGPDGTAKLGPDGKPITVLSDQQKSVNQNITNLLNGTTLAGNLAGLQPVLDARTQVANLQQPLIDEQRAANANINATQLGGLGNLANVRTAGAGSIYDATAAGAHGISDASLAGLANLLGVRQQGAGDIYGATVQGAGGVRDAQQAAAQGISTADLAGLQKLLGVQTQGAQDVYGAQLTQADTYQQAAQQALQGQLAEQAAQRARQGFVGTSSGSDLERARLMAQYLQAGAGARAGAGVSLEQTLANARQSNSQSQLQDAINLATGVGAANTGYATNVGNAGVQRSTSLAGAAEQNSLGQLNTGVNLATSLAGAGTNRATQIAGANEQLATGQLGANTQLATANAGLLNTNATIAKAQADLQNAIDKLQLTLKGQSDQINASGLPNSNASGTIQVGTQQTGAAYDQLTALLKALQPFTINQAGGPNVTTATPGSVLNTNQVLGGALTGLGTAVGNTASSNNLADLLKLLGSPSTAPSATTANPYPLGQTPVFMTGAKSTFG